MAGEEESRIFVGGLSWETDERKLEDVFRRFGKVVDAQMMLERHTHRHRGFGFVTFSDPRAVDGAIKDMHNQELDGRTISVCKAEPKMNWYDSSGGRGPGVHGGVPDARVEDDPGSSIGATSTANSENSPCMVGGEGQEEEISSGGGAKDATSSDAANSNKV